MGAEETKTARIAGKEYYRKSLIYKNFLFHSYYLMFFVRNRRTCISDIIVHINCFSNGTACLVLYRRERELPQKNPKSI